MNYIKYGLSALLVVGLMISCGEDDQPEPSGLSNIIFSSFSVDASGDGTVITVTPVSIGASSFTVDFGDQNSEADVLTINEQGGSATYDYPNEEEEVEYVISVTALSDAGLTSITLTDTIDVVHVPAETLTTIPSAPSGSISNIFAIYSDGMEVDGGLLEYRWGEAASGGVAVTVGEANVLRLTRLGSDAGVLSVATIDPASAFGDGIGATHMHFDVYSDFSEGIDILKVTLVNTAGSESYEVDGLALTDGDWAGFDLTLSTDFSGAVAAIDEITFELGTGGTANDHASIYVDNIYLYKETGSTILNGDFEISGTFATSQWRFTTFTEGTTDPFGSSSDGSDWDYDGVEQDDKTRGAKWTSSQSGGPLQSTNSRYAYQALSLTPATEYVLQYQYAIDDDNDDPVGVPRHLAGLILDGHFMDGADAVAAIGDNLGIHLGYIAEGKFNTTPIDYGTFVEVPFTSNESGEVAVMFYSVAPDDAWIDNVRVIEAANVTAPTPDFTADASSENYLEYTFSNTSLNGASFHWDFGDGNTSTEKSPTHTYAADGDYDVVLTATNVAGSTMANETVEVAGPAVPATFAAVLQNADFQSFPTAEENSNDLVDAWTIDPDNTFNDGTDTPFNFWRNDDLESYVTGLPDAGTDKGSASTTNAMSAGGTSGRSFKTDSNGERAYQPFEVEDGVEYSISAWVRKSSNTAGNLIGTFYILSDEPSQDDDPTLAPLTLVKKEVVGVAGGDEWIQTTFSFTVTDTFNFPQDRVDENASDILTSIDQKFVLFYFVPNDPKNTGNVFLTDVVIETPGF